MAVFTADAVLTSTRAGSFTASAVIKRNQTSSFTVNAIQKKTSQVPVDLVYPGVIGAGPGSNTNIHAGPLRITPNTQITIRVYSQSDGNLGIFSGTTAVLANATQNTWDDNPIGVHVFTSTNRWVWVYSFAFNGGRTGNGTVTTDQTTPTFTVDALRGKTTTGTFTANAVFIPRRFTADATVLRVQTGSRPVDALIVPLRFWADAVIFRPDQLRTFTVSAWFALRITGTPFTVNAIQKKTSIVPVVLTYPGFQGAGATANANIHAGPIRITPGTAITIRVSAQSDGNLGIVAGTTNVLASTTQNTFTNTPVGIFAPTVTGSNRFVWVYSFAFNGSRTGAGTATTDQTTPVFTVDAFKGYRFRADALIKASRTGSFTVDATKGDMFFRASAVIATTRIGTFTADARKINVPITGSFTADAIRLKTIIPVGPPGTIFLDTFSTPTSAPPFNAGTADIGNSFVWTDWDSYYNSAALSPTHVDAGGYLTVTANQWDSMRGASLITVGELYLDFWVPASGDNQQRLYWYDSQWWVEYQDQQANYQVIGQNANGLWPVTRSAWHRLHVIVDGATVRAHIWKVGDAEPGTYTTVQTVWPVAFTGNATYLAQAPIVDMYYAPSTEALRIDNIQIYGLGTPALTADALKLRPQTGSRTANAVIKALDRSGSFTADALISQGYFRANAVIATSGAGSFTVSALKRKTVSGSFTADAYYNRSFTGSFPANSLLKASGAGSFTVDYMTWSGVGPPPPLIGVPTKIFVNGVEITSHVMWKTASFSAKVNAQSGECTFDVVDRAHDLTFSFGDEVQLYIDGVLRWGGWIVQVNRQFPFSVMKAPATEARIFHIAGVDYNRFLDRRVLHDSGSPNRTWNYPAGTYDDTIFNNLWSYFDTTGFTKNIHRVGAGVLDIPGVTAKTGGNVAQGGFTMRDCLMHLSWDTGAIFYVTPQKVVTYVDADLVSNPYTLTDQPSGPLDVGFHDVRIIEDSTEMVNDAIVWGAGKGSNQVVESRYQSPESQADHGRWQSGNFTAGIYKQATANAVSRAAVEGSPVSLRGAKNPKRAVELLTWSPVFGIGDVVNFHDSQFFMPPADPDDAPTHDDVLPIRTMTITWPTPTAPLFALQLSWEVDAVWSFFDPWLPVGAPGLGGGGTGPGGLPPGGQEPVAGCADDGCGITDGFADRIAGPAVGAPGAQADGPLWGTADIGTAWELSGIFPTAVDAFHNTSNAYISGGVASFAMPQSNVNSFGSVVDAFLDGFPGPASESYFLIRARWSGSSLDTDSEPWASLIVGPSVGNGQTSLFWNFNHSSSSYGAGSGNSIGVGVNGSSPFFTFTAQATPDMRDNAWWWYRVVRTTTTVTLTYWPDGTDEPSTPNISHTLPGTAYRWSESPSFVDISGNQGSGSSNVFGALRLDISYLDVGGASRCDAVQFDNFDRIITGAWGTAIPSGVSWGNAGPGGYTLKAVGDGGWGKIEQGSGFTGGQTMIITTGGVEQWGGDFTMSSAFKITSASASAEAAQAIGVTQSSTGFFVNHGIWVVKNQGAVNGNDKLGFVEAGVGGTYASKTWTVGVIYEMRYQKEGTTHRVKSWVRGTTEPAGWDVTVTGVGVITPNQLVVFSQRESSSLLTWGVWRDYIDFDYSGRPCYIGCSPTDGSLETFDNFNRTVGAPGSTLNWGATSGGSNSWLIQSPTSLTGRVAYVDGTRGVITATSTGSQLRSVNPIIDWSLGGVPAPTFPFVQTYDVDISNIVGDSVYAYGLSFAGRTGPGSLDYAWFECLLYNSGYVGGPRSMFDTSISGSGDSVKYSAPITSGTITVVADFTTCTVYHNGSQIYQDVWRNFDLEPMVVPDGTALTQMDMGVGAGFSGSGPTMTITSSISNISFKDRRTWGTYCTDTDPNAGGDGVPSGTHLTEDLTPLSTATGAPPTYPANSHWQATNSILPGSAVLTVGGAIQYGNWSIYDAAAGIIQYNPTLVATSTVSLTYITNGAL